MKLVLLWLCCVAALASFPSLTAGEGGPQKGIDWEDGGGKIDAGPEATTQPASGLPRVLVIGDSISIGYTPPLKELLKGKAEVKHPPGNCMDSGNGVKNVRAWLGNGKWDVIHFNFGIWDTHYLTNENNTLIRDESKIDLATVHIRNSLEQYRENLKKIISVLKPTGAKLIFCTTTPVLYRKGARFEDIEKYNAVAVEVMKEAGIEVNDFYSAALKYAAQWIGGDKVHMASAGNTGLAKLAADRIEAALANPATPGRK